MIALPTIQVISPYHFEIRWPSKISESVLLEMIGFKLALVELFKNQSYQLTLGYHVIAVFFESPGKIMQRIDLFEKALEQRKIKTLTERKRWEIPVCYEVSLAQDLEAFCLQKKLDIKQVVHMHTTVRYLLHFYGFLPGFMYLGGLDKGLFQPRKENPDREIPAGSVAIGGEQTGIYPTQSPGGWHVIGRCPTQLIGHGNLPPFEPGDEITFSSITLEEFKKLKDSPAKDLCHEPF